MLVDDRGPIPAAVWGIVQDRTTPIQYRRLRRLAELPGSLTDGMRQVGREEKVDHKNISRSVQLGLRRCEGDIRLWMFWLFGARPISRRPTSYWSDESTDAERELSPADLTDEESAGGWQGHVPHANSAEWESDAYNSPSPVERQADGYIAYHDGAKLRQNPYNGPHGEAWATGWQMARAEQQAAKSAA